MATNSISPFSKASNADLLESIGITQFPSEFEWYQLIGGLLFQGGKIEVPNGAATVFDFVTPFPKQLLGVFLTPSIFDTAYGVTASDLETFSVAHNKATQDFYWWAIGL